jgi:exosortase
MTRVQRNLASVLFVATGFAILYWRIFGRLISDWATDDNYSHGFLIVPIALYLCWERRERFTALPDRPTIVGLGVVALSLLALCGGVLGAELFLARVSMIGTVAGIVLFLFGWASFRLLLFPLAFLLLMVPLPAIIFNQIAFPLQLLASRVGEFALTALAIPVLREGNVLVLATTSLEVAEACSGIRSLVSLLTLGIMFGYFMDPRSWVRTVVALSTIPVAIAANGLRVAGTGVAANYFGPEVAHGFVHTFSGWLLFLVAFGMMLVFQRLITRFAPLAAPSNPSPIAAAA